MSTVQRVQDALESAVSLLGLDVEVCLDYSGRFMFGQRCPSISGHPADLTEVLGRVSRDEPELYDAVNLGRPTTDSMGLGAVWYWPSLNSSDVPCNCSDCNWEDED